VVEHVYITRIGLGLESCVIMAGSWLDRTDSGPPLDH
jgi:hypothetical protein